MRAAITLTFWGPVVTFGDDLVAGIAGLLLSNHVAGFQMSTIVDV